MAKAKSDPDRLLAPEQFPELNKLFYATKPWDYFDRRHLLLVLAAGAEDKLEDIVRDGVSYKTLSYGVGAEEDGEDQEDGDAEKERERFVIAESQVLLHHVSETLLRLYLAHEPLGPCPWLELARVRGPGDFKQRVEQRFLGDMPQEERRERVAKVFYATADREKVKPLRTEEDWNKGLDNIDEFLVHYARQFLDADPYNALKHGLAVRPGEARAQLGGGGELFKAEGPSIEYISLRKKSDGERSWHRSTSWIQVERSMGLTYLAARLIGSLWSIARFRYLKERPEALRLWNAPLYREVMKPLAEGEKSGMRLESLHMELAYYAEPDEPEAEDGDDPALDQDP